MAGDIQGKSNCWLQNLRDNPTDLDSRLAFVPETLIAFELLTKYFNFGFKMVRFVWTKNN